MTITDKTEALRKVLMRYSRRKWSWICDYGPQTKWCKLGLLIAKRELGMTWREAGACFGLKPGQASSVARKFEDKVFEEPALFDMMTNLSFRVLESLGQTCESHQERSSGAGGPLPRRG